MAICIHCKAEIPDGSTFCLHCGKKQVHRYSQVFRRGEMSEDEFIYRINDWFARYPHVANVRGKFFLEHGFGILVNSYVMNALAIEYEVFSGPCDNQYGVAKLDDLDLVHCSPQELLAKWRQANPDVHIVDYRGGSHHRGHMLSFCLNGVGAMNKTQLYVLYKIKRSKIVSSLPPQEMK